MPLFLAALLAARGLPALLYRPLVGGRMAFIAGLLQATSLPFLVAAAQIGIELGLLSRGTGAALIAAGLLSVLVFPLVALRMLRDPRSPPTASRPSSTQAFARCDRCREPRC